MKKELLSALCVCVAAGCANTDKGALKVTKIDGAKPRNVILILTDDHRFDYMGFLNTVPWLETPTLDRLAAEGAYVRNAFVTTSLSSPSRASILTSLFSHEHTVVDNQAPTPEGLTYFPEYLQQVGYQTAFLGKWHMGNTGWDPQPGFNHWESFKGQGDYYGVEMNVNGQVKKFGDDEYVTDLLTDHAIEFIEQNKEQPFFVYLSHKAVHDPFEASDKNRDMYSNVPMQYPANFNVPVSGSEQRSPSKDATGHPMDGNKWYGKDRLPDWVKAQRESWHGVEYSYHGRTKFEEECFNYCEALTSLDDSVAELMKYLEDNGLAEETLIIYMSDNGFCWGEHGLIDKRTFYETSVRIPMLAYCPAIIEPGIVIDNMVQNIDVAPTIMEACGIEKAEQMQGQSIMPLLQGQSVDNWRDRIFYEYYWEYDFPQTPTTFGVRTDNYKYIRYHGIWDTNELYDIINDPHETKNLIAMPEHQELVKSLNKELYDWLDRTNGMNILLKETLEHRLGDHRNMEIY